MGKNVTIKWYGKADQGIMAAASILAEVMALEGKYVQAFPEFNLKRCGALTEAFNRISSTPIRVHSLIENADIQVVLDPAIMKYMDIKTDSKDDTVYIIGTSLSPETIKEKCNLSTNKVFTFDTDSNPPHIGLMTIVINCMELIPIDNFKERLKEILAAKLDNDIVLEHVKIVDEALNEVKEA